MIILNGREYGNAKDLAQVFGKSPDTIRRWVRQGKLPHGAPHPGGTIWAMEKVAKMLDKQQATDKEIATILACR